MGLYVDDIVAKFSTKTIPTISGEPDYASISNMVQLRYGNARFLPTTQQHTVPFTTPFDDH
jgi:hypothetical protein